jgi:hypothetical protein
MGGPTFQFLDVTNALAMRVWRLRRRTDHIDASIRQVGDTWELTYAMNERPLVTSSFSTRREADTEASARKRELQRVGWTLHW